LKDIGRTQKELFTMRMERRKKSNKIEVIKLNVLLLFLDQLELTSFFAQFESKKESVPCHNTAITLNKIVIAWQFSVVLKRVIIWSIDNKNKCETFVTY
jgi:hypothetical protein